MIVSPVSNLFFIPVLYVNREVDSRTQQTRHGVHAANVESDANPREASLSDLICVTALQPGLRYKGSSRN